MAFNYNADPFLAHGRGLVSIGKFGRPEFCVSVSSICREYQLHSGLDQTTGP